MPKYLLIVLTTDLSPLHPEALILCLAPLASVV